MRRLKFVENRARRFRFLNPDETVVAAVHGHESRWTMLLPEMTFFCFGRMVVVTSERVIVFGPGFRTIIDQAFARSGALRRDGTRMCFTGADGSELSLFNGPGQHRQADRVVQATAVGAAWADQDCEPELAHVA